MCIATVEIAHCNGDVLAGQQSDVLEGHLTIDQKVHRDRVNEITSKDSSTSFFYFKDINEYSHELVESYVKSGEVETVFLREKHDGAGNEWQIAGVQDCLHRNRHYFRYSIFADLDERIMALRNSTLADYVLATMMDCRRVLAMAVHQSKSLFPGYKEMVASTGKALIMHYRSIDGGQFRTRSLPILATFGPFEMTYYPEHLMRHLYSNLKRRLSIVYGSERAGSDVPMVNMST
ncbi:hypothetical protein Aduo_004104 [Ancylostoma duodenale]